MGWSQCGVVLLVVTACGCDSSEATRNFVDALGLRCGEKPFASFVQVPDGCQQPLAVGAPPSCQGTPEPSATCVGSTPCWTITGVSTDATGFGIVGDGPAAPADGGFVSFDVVCAACCSPSDAGQITDMVSNCAAIPCNSVVDCPYEACACVHGWCE